MKKEIVGLLINSAKKCLLEIEEKGYIAGGSNGPYNDNETPYRVCAHWIFIFDYLYQETNDKKYLNAIKKLGEYLYKEFLNNKHVVFKCRQKEGKDTVNGTIGNAWIIEGLIKLSEILKDDKYYYAAVEIFKCFSYDKNMGLWNRIEYDGKELGFDGTFNHQLWLAAAGTQILAYKDNKAIRDEINDFLSHCKSNLIFNIYNDGLIKHFSLQNRSLKSIVKYYLRDLKNSIKGLLNKPNMRYKEEGYHYFAMYGFALVYSKFYDHSLFKTNKFRKSLKYTFNKENYLKLINQNKYFDGTKLASKFDVKSNIYAYAYNSPFLELPYIYKTFKGELMNNDEFNELWNIQKDITVVNNYMSKNTNDPVTLSARMYELVRYLEDSNFKLGD